MILYKLTASFGKLDGSIELREGMNLIELPNEGGKSTWSAFLLAMLYGIDTRERGNAANEGLPVKERYKPWSGKPMEGSIELDWNGRHITLERKSGPRGPMSLFRAYYTDSGHPVSELTAENCGQQLCGVERSVFERSAFIRQLGLSVTADDALEQRLRALITTGEEHGKTATQLEKELRSLKNQLSGKSGRIAAITRELAALRERKEDLRHTRDQLQAAVGEQSRLQKQLDELEEKLRRVEKAKFATPVQDLSDLSESQAEQEERCQKLKEMVEHIPSESKLLHLQRELRQAEQQFQAARMDRACVPAPIAPPPVPEYFAETENPKEQVERDLCTFDACVRHWKPSPLWLLLWVALLLSGVTLTILLLTNRLLQPQYWLIPTIFAVLSAVGMVFHLLQYRKGFQAQEEMWAILAHYGAESRQDIEDCLRLYLDEQQSYITQFTADHRQQQTAEDAILRAQQSLNSIVRRVAVFAPEAVNLNEAKRAIDAALLAHNTYATERRFLAQQRTGMGDVRLLLDSLPPQDKEALCWDEKQLRHEKELVRQQLQTATYRRADLQNKADSLGDWVELSAAEDYLKTKLREDEETEAALFLAQEALQQAAEDLRSRFSPPITAEASRILAQLTGGKYANLLMDVEMHLSLRNEGLSRPAAAMSCGTIDQMYLALRLAMCRLLLPKDVPLLLDDALVNFDPVRTAAAMELLQQEGRQILLFTCRPL